MNARYVQVTNETAKHSLGAIIVAAGTVAVGLLLLVVLS